MNKTTTKSVYLFQQCCVMQTFLSALRQTGMSVVQLTLKKYTYEY